MASGKYAQYGEDAIIDSVLARLDNLTYSVVEFGAADGFFCSNTAHLWHDSGWSATLIESEPDLYEQLLVNVGGRLGSTVLAYCGKVENLDHFTSVVTDVCSMDVDGNEYQILDCLQTRHRVLVVEHNPTVPPHIEMVNEKNTMMGSSALSLTKLAVKKGYGLVGATTCNLVFVREEEDLSSRYVELEDVFDRSCLNYVVTDYNGGYEMVGKWPYGFVGPRRLGLR
jgi:hypothetical protein